ncbi:ATP-binding protein [Streptomyces gamaensis]|uniref:ATP-binding protein n=1 Tax=Streptomyces gamaensis TaxID=1763542 RepID=A0ABW0Z7J2_9ACTN
MVTVSASQPWTYTLELPRDPRAPGVARTTLRTVLQRHGMPALIDVAELLTSELVTNTYVHTDGPCSMRLRGDPQGERLRVSVWDTSPRIPPLFNGPPRTIDREADNGRGLTLIRLCASNWGSYTFDPELFGSTSGKMLWFELAPRGTGSYSPIA